MLLIWIPSVVALYLGVSFLLLETDLEIRLKLLVPIGVFMGWWAASAMYLMLKTSKK